MAQSSYQQLDPSGIPSHFSSVDSASDSLGIPLSASKASSYKSNGSDILLLPKDNVSLQVAKRNPTKSGRALSLKAFLRNSVLFFAGLLKYGTKEEKKVVVDQSRWLVLRRCSIHFLPTMATITLVSLRFQGYFIGSNFQGSSTSRIDTVDTLALQLASKLMELLIVASLSRMVLDIIRYETILGRDGIPFGLLGAASSFKEISFFFTPRFWYCRNAISSRYRRYWLSGILCVSGLIAVFAGPSSALLMIPTIEPAWPAGGADFWLIGNSSSLWPSQLDSSTVGGLSCLNPTEKMLSDGALSSSGCIWYSISTIAQAFQSWHFHTFFNVTIIETTYKRTVGVVNFGPEVWAVSTNPAVGLVSDYLANVWQRAVWSDPIKQQKTSSYYNYNYRLYEDTIAQVQTKLPAARASCNLYDNSRETTTTLGFPVLPEYGASGSDTFIVPATIVNSSSILTRWLPMLAGTTTTKNGNQTSDYPSAFLTIQIPHYQSKTEFAVFACSVDARWALGNNIATNIINNAYESDSLQHGEVLHSVPLSPENLGNPFLPVPGGSWSKISIDLDWLYTLTPLLNSSSELTEARSVPGWTSYASLLTYIGMGNDTSLVTNWQSISLTLEASLAVMVAEGLARIGFSANGGNWKFESYPPPTLNIPKTTAGFTNDVLQSILKDDGNAVYPPKGFDAENLTQLHWGITISGYAYKADSLGHYLATAVLLVHIVLVIGHITYSFRTNQSSDTWGSFEDMMALSHGSEPNPQALRNTSAGVDCRTTMQRKVRIRVADGSKRVIGHEELQLLFDTVPEVGYETVLPGRKYGAVD